MCGLLGYMNYGDSKAVNVNRAMAELAWASTSRGTDATGVAYVLDGKMEIDKKAVAGHKFKFELPEDTRVAMGHVRATTHGTEKDNFNNHPFRGRAGDKMFALAHNGILDNYLSLQYTHELPKTKIKTDSYVAVQLLEKAGALTLETVRNMAETVSGMFTFTILDEDNRLWIVKNDAPFYMFDFQTLGIMLYGSTDEIVLTAAMQLIRTREVFTDMLIDKKVTVEMHEPDMGEIWVVEPNGEIGIYSFKPNTRRTYSYNYSKGKYADCVQKGTATTAGVIDEDGELADTTATVWATENSIDEKIFNDINFCNKYYSVLSLLEIGGLEEPEQTLRAFLLYDYTLDEVEEMFESGKLWETQALETKK